VKDINDTEYLVKEKLQNNREYYWRVRADVQSFTIGNTPSTNQDDSPIVFELLIKRQIFLKKRHLKAAPILNCLFIFCG